MDESYFLEDAVRYAKSQGRDIDDKLFVEKFQRRLSNLPSSKVLRKKWLELFIKTTIEEYNAHIKKMNGSKCEPQCESTIAYKRGIPHAEAELRKIDPLYLGAEMTITFIKKVPVLIFKKLPLAIFKFITTGNI